MLWLGPELRIVYNDTYIPFLGDTKHPAMLGAPGREAWGEIWETVGPLHEEVAALFDERLCLRIFAGRDRDAARLVGDEGGQRQEVAA